MPSGAKKRKAKKKKENHPNHPDPSSSTTHVGDDVKNGDGKEIEVGEVYSPASEVHHSLPSVEEGEETREKGIKTIEEKHAAQIEKDDGSSGSYSGSSSSTGSSSDDESHDIKPSPPPVVDTPFADPVKPADLLSETPAEPIHIATIDEAGVSALETPVVDEIVPLVEKVEESTSASSCLASQENGGEVPSPVEVKAGISTSLVDEPAVRKEDEICFQSVENTGLVPESKTTADNGAAHEEFGKTELNRPLLGHPEQKASWKSCCGLFELFGSR